MSEPRYNTKVKDIVMNYQQNLRSTSSPIPYRTDAPGPNVTIHRKAVTYSPIPNNPTSAYRSVTQPVPSTATSRSNTSGFAASSINTPASSISVSPVSQIVATDQQSSLPTASSATASAADEAKSTLSAAEIDKALSSCLNVLIDATTHHSKRPFSALLLAPDHTTVLQSHNSVSHVQHAECELARIATSQYSLEFLSRCTLVSTWEPCAMCSGTIYWAGIRRVLYAASETQLKELTGENNSENMTMSLPCRTVFAAGQRPTEVIGPVTRWEAKVVLESKKWWDAHRGHIVSAQTDHHPSSLRNGYTKSDLNHNPRNSVVVVENPDLSGLGNVGDDGEYKADLQVDWF